MLAGVAQTGPVPQFPVAYDIPDPMSGGRIQVYLMAGGWEYRLVGRTGWIQLDTGFEGSGAGYGQPELALRDALIVATS